MHCSGHHLRQMNVAEEVHIVDNTLTLPHSALATVHMFNKTGRSADDQCLHRKNRKWEQQHEEAAGSVSNWIEQAAKCSAYLQVDDSVRILRLHAESHVL